MSSGDMLPRRFSTTETPSARVSRIAYLHLVTGVELKSGLCPSSSRSSARCCKSLPFSCSIAVLPIPFGARYDPPGYVYLARRLRMGEFDALNIFRVPAPHSVSQAPLYGGLRYSVTGWLHGRC